MKDYVFETEQEYLEWCRNKIGVIYYANIAMNGDRIREVIADIASTLHCSEGQYVIKPEGYEDWFKD